MPELVCGSFGWTLVRHALQRLAVVERRLGMTIKESRILVFSTWISLIKMEFVIKQENIQLGGQQQLGEVLALFLR